MKIEDTLKDRMITIDVTGIKKFTRRLDIGMGFIKLAVKIIPVDYIVKIDIDNK